MIKWKKPSGLEIQTGDNLATVKLAESLGWVRAEQKKKAKPAKPSKPARKLKSIFDEGRSAKDGDSSPGN